MIADVIPFIRLPRQLVSFSYQVPPDLAKQIAVGHYVSIPFRAEKISGLVISVKAENSSGLKSLLKIINPIPLIGADYLAHLKNLAAFYGVSLSVATTLALPPLQSRKIMEMDIEPWQEKSVSAAGQKPRYHWYKNSAEHNAAYAHYTDEKIIIIVPEVARIAEVIGALSPARQAEVLVSSSELSQKEQRTVWFAIRNHTARTVVATRGALWLPLQQSFDRIIVDYEHSTNLKHWDQTPRYHTKDLAKLLSRNFGLAYNEMSYSPSVSSWYFMANGNYESTPAPTAAGSGQFDSPIIIQQAPNIRKPGKIYAQTLAHIEDALVPGTDTVIIHNRKGAAQQILCNECGFVNRCPRCELPMIFHKAKNALVCHYCMPYGTKEIPVPTVCPKCQSPNLVLAGTGIEAVAREITHKISDQNIRIIQVSAETPLPQITPETKQEARLIVGTHSVLGALDWQRVGLIALLDCDTQLHYPEYAAEETVWHTIQDILFHKNPAAPFIIQTRQPEHRIFTLLSQPSEWYAKELEVRESLGYPPFSYLVRYLISGKTELEAKERAEHTALALTRRLTNTRKKIILQGPLAAEPRYMRSAYWQVIMLKILESDILSAVLAANSLIENQVKIDPHPISLLNPH